MTRKRSACRMRSIMSSLTRRSASVCCTRSRASSAIARARASRSGISGLAIEDLTVPTGIALAARVEDDVRLSCRDQPMQAWAGSHRGNAVHLHVERTVPGRDADEAARRRVRWKVPRIDRIDRLEMRRIGAIDVAPDDSIER